MFKTKTISKYNLLYIHILVFVSENNPEDMKIFYVVSIENCKRHSKHYKSMTYEVLPQSTLYL